jgi:hypothetical protein
MGMAESIMPRPIGRSDWFKNQVLLALADKKLCKAFILLGL